MANPIYLTLASTTTSRTVNLDYRQTPPFNVSVAVTGSSSGTFTYTVNYTLQDQNYLTQIGSTLSVVWFADANLNAVSSNGTTNYMFPVAGIQLSATALSSAALVMSVLQGGP